MDRRKLKALKIVERIRSHELDAEASRLGQMQSEMAELERERTRLERSLLRQGTESVMVEYAPYLGTFIRAVRHEIGRCDGRMTTLSHEIEAQEVVVSRKFTEKKTVDLVAGAEAQRLAAAAARKERVAQDDLTIMRHRAYTQASRLS